MRLRSHLVVVVLVAVLPVVVFSAVLVVLFAGQHQSAVERGLRETTRALALAVDSRLASSIRALEVLAASPALDATDVAAFRPVAERARSVTPEWTDLALLAPDGGEVMTLRLPPPAAERRVPPGELVRSVFEHRRPVVSNHLAGQRVVQIVVPVVRGQRVAYALAAMMATTTFDQLLAEQRIPADWTGAILDRDKVILARSRDPDRFVGARATTVLAARSTEAAEGLFRDVTQEGRVAFGAFSRSMVSGWTIVLGAPASVMDVSAQRPLWLLVGGGLALLVLGVGLAAIFGRRVSAAIVSLARSAEALGRGDRRPAPPSVIDEIDVVRTTLDRTDALMRERSVERERAEHENTRLLAEAQEARAASEAARQDADFLVEATTSLAASLEYEATLRQLARLTVRRLADWCVIDVRDDRGATSRVATAARDPLKEPIAASLVRFPAGSNPHNPVERALATGRLVTGNDVTDSAIEAIARDPEHLAVMRRLGIRAYAMVPLVARGRTLGVVSFVRSTGSYGPRELGLAEALAARAASAIDNARLYGEAQAASRSKDEFLAMLSHELRTPLTSILGWAGLLRRGNLDRDTADRAIDTIERNARLQTQLVEDLLDVSAIVTGKLRLDLEPIDLLSIVDAVVDSLRSAAASKGVRLEPDLQPVGLVSGDPARLEQVIANIVSNAIKFTPEGGRVAITLTRVEMKARVTVIDTGRGIPPEFLPHVFEHFRQAEPTTTRSHRGLGLGLAIVRHLVELHEGTVSATSDGAGRGATFVVELPVLAPADADPTRPGAMAEPVPELDGMNVLLVEDDADTRELLKTILERKGALVTATDSAAAARLALGRSSPDVVVSDIMMPDEDGYELMRWFRSRERGRAHRTPAVALTAYAAPQDRARVLDAGYDLHLAKPVEPTTLIRAVAGIARRANA